MIVDNINLNLLRVFEVVYRTLNMTVAAKELHMTQSGVSQNIRALEEVLDITFFDRIKQKLIPTENAHLLYQTCSQNFLELENTLISIKGVDKELQGRVSIGIPIEYGNNVILPLIAQLGKSYPKIRFHLSYGHIAVFKEQLFRGEMDFAFIDDFSKERGIVTEKVAHETLVLVSSQDYIAEKGPVKNTKKWFETLDYIDYMEDYPILKQWFSFHYPHKKIEVNVRASLMDVQGMGRMIVLGLGVGILPYHVVTKLQKLNHELYLFKGSGRPLQNTISMAYLKGKGQSPAVIEVMQYLRDNLNDPKEE